MGMNRSTVSLVLALLLLSSCVFASGFQTPGIGGKARGMGGAFRAIADDWTAAYYNPAGYAFINDNQLGFSQGFYHPRLELTPSYVRGSGTSTYDIGVYDELLYNRHEILSMPSAGFAVKLPYFGETVWGLSAFQPFDNHVSWNVWEPDPAYNQFIIDNLPHDQIKSDIDVIAFQLTAAKTFMEEKLSVGIGLKVLKADIWVNDFIILDNPVWDARPKDYVAEFTYNKGSGTGFGATLGLLYKVNEQLTVGLTASSPSEIDIDGESYQRYAVPMANAGDTSLFMGGANDSLIRISNDFETTLKLPGVYGFGVAYNVNEKFTVSFDAEYVTWSDFEGFVFNYRNFDLSQIRTKTDNEAFFTTSSLSSPATWVNTMNLSFGMNYVQSDVLTLLGGFSLDQSPLRENDEFTPMYVETGDRYGFNGGLLLNLDQWELGLIVSYFNYPDDKTISNAVDYDGDSLADSFPGLYSASAFETILSVNYRF